MKSLTLCESSFGAEIAGGARFVARKEAIMDMVYVIVSNIIDHDEFTNAEIVCEQVFANREDAEAWAIDQESWRNYYTVLPLPVVK